MGEVGPDEVGDGRTGPPTVLVAALAAVLLLGSVVGLAVVDGQDDWQHGRASACGPVVHKSDGTAWRCDFADDFDGTRLDPAKWMATTTQATQLTYGDCWVDRPANIRVADGTVRLTTRREAQPVTCTAGDRTVASDHTSGSITTWGRYTTDQGRVAIRARTPDVRVPGVQSALWLYPETVRYRDTLGSGEIDVAEYFSLYPDWVVPTMHYVSAAGPTVTNQDCLVEDPSTWHTYVVEWDRRRVRVLVDGRTCLDHAIAETGATAPGQPFDQDYTINLTQTLGSGANVPTPSTPFPATLEVDYVRAWK
jgi:beta-glucanase (GH16 family)